MAVDKGHPLLIEIEKVSTHRVLIRNILICLITQKGFMSAHKNIFKYVIIIFQV